MKRRASGRAFHHFRASVEMSWVGLSEQVPGVLYVVFRFGHAAAASGNGRLKEA